MLDDRLLPLVGGHNFRDFGGDPTMDGGQVRRGLLFRSGLMSHLTADDVTRLRTLGIATICDLRTLAERADRPTQWLGEDGDLIADDATESTTTLRALLADGSATFADAHSAMVALYRELPFKHLTMYRTMFRRLVEGRVPLLVNCAAGKDRTGVAAALVLRALNVAPDRIERDFLASGDAIDVPRLLADSGFASAPQASSKVVAAMMTVAPEYLAATFASIDARCGSFDRYRDEELGIDDDDLDGLRSLLLIPTASSSARCGRWP